VTERLREIELAIVAAWPDTVRIWRQSVGNFLTHGGRSVTIGIPGMADLSGIGPGGRRIEIEVKDATRPHRDRAVIARQERWGGMIERMGGIYIQATGPEDAIEQLREAIET